MPNADLKKFLPKRMVDVVGQNIPAIINAFNQGADDVEQTIQACIDQLFITTASGKYLLTLGEEGGFAIPPNSALDVRAFRILVPIMVSNPKQVRISVNDLVQAFYGSERTKANVSASIFGPYNLDTNDDLSVETDAGSFTVNILSSQVSNINNVSATELASIINYTQSLVLADTVLDRATGLEKLRLSSKTQGAGSFVRITGGKIQNVLQFDKLCDTNLQSGMTFSVTKSSLLSDEVIIQWNGIGSNPKLYNVKTNDVLTIRGLIDVGPDPLENLNGTYVVIDSGYDYIKIRNSSYPDISSALILPENNTFVFTKSDKITLFDRTEYAFTSEVSDQTITVTVPAIPPLTLRFLNGSAHLQGTQLAVEDFTRTSVQFVLPNGVDAPSADNQFLISNNYSRLNFVKKRYNTYATNDDPNFPIYQISPFDGSNAIFPYTNSTSIGSNTLFASVDSPVLTANFPFPHGLERGWGFNLSNAVGGGNFSSIDLTKEHVVKNINTFDTLQFTVKDSLGEPKPFSGFSFGPADVYRYTTSQSDGSDFYIEFPDSSSLVAAGFDIGYTFKFDPLVGTDVDPFYAGELKYKRFSVVSIINTGLIHRVNFITGFGPGPTGLIIQSAEGFRSGFIPGSTFYYFDKTSTYNTTNVFPNLKATFLEATQSSNPGFVGSFIYDPQGVKTGVTVSKYIANITDNILKGEALSTVFVDSLTNNGEFPKSGKLIIGYGTNRFEGPINYFATISTIGANQIVVDPAYKFKYSHPVGETVQFIHDTQPFVPDKFGEAYPAYITGTTQARDAMFSLIETLVAAGVFVEREVILPDLRYDDQSIAVFE